MLNDDWLERLQLLAARFSYLGVCPDIAAISLIEAWGLYRFLLNLSGGE